MENAAMTEPKQCEVCHIGTMHPMRAAYTTWLHGHLVIVPDVHAWLCDVCGEFEHAEDIIARIEFLLGNQPVNSSLAKSRSTAGDASHRMMSSSNRTRSA
jgi:YgiT-type zinc finger domain-containing protein